MNRKEFLSALEMVKPCIKKNTVVPILSNVFFRDGQIEAFNGIQGMKIYFNSGLNCAVDGTDLIKLVSSLISDEIDLIENEKFLTIKSGKSNYELAIEPTKTFFPDSKNIIFKIIDESFIIGYKKCLDFASKDISLEDRCGVTVNDKYLYSTNGVGIAKYELNKGVGIKSILPEQFLKLISNIHVKDEDTLIGINDKTVFVETNDVSIFTMINTVDLLDYETILDKYIIKDISYTEITDELKIVIDRLDMLSDSSKEIFFLSKNGSIEMGLETGKINSSEKLDLSLKNEFSSKFDISLLRKLKNNSFQIASVLINEDILLIGRDDEFICVIAHLPSEK